MLRLTKAGLRIREAYTVLDRRRVRAVLEQLPSAARNQVLSALQTLAKAATTMMRNPRGRAPHGKKFSRGASP